MKTTDIAQTDQRNALASQVGSKPYRRITTQCDGCDRVYRVPKTGHWAAWRDADAVAYHGELVAVRLPTGWVGAGDSKLSRSDIARFARLRSVGISTR